MRVHLGRDSHSATHDMIATHATVRHLTSKVEGLGHKIFMDNFFSSPRLFDDLDRRKTNSCRTVQPSRRDMPRDFWTKITEIEKGWRKDDNLGRFDRISLEGQTRSLHADNMDSPPAEGNFCDNSNRPMKPHIMGRYKGTQVTSTVLIIWLTAIRWVKVPSSGPRNYFSTFWI